MDGFFIVGLHQRAEIVLTNLIGFADVGGGFGDAKINMRGFQSANVAVLVNGIPVNDMEGGWVYWSNWIDRSNWFNRSI